MNIETPTQLARMICDELLSQPHFNRQKLEPIIEAILNAYLSKTNMVHIISSNKSNFEKTYMQRVVQMLAPERIQEFYNELNAMTLTKDFTVMQSQLAIPTGYTKP